MEFAISTKVGNLKDGRKPALGVSVGRGSKWGNPFRMDNETKRGLVIKQYATWLKDQPHLLNAVGELKDKELHCYCAPKPCHGHVLLMLTKGQTIDDVITYVCGRL